MESDIPEQLVRAAEVSVPANSSFKRVQVEDSDVSSIDDQDELLPRPVRKKRPNRRYTEWSSDDEYCLRALKRSFPKYKEVDSSSESESDFTRPTRDTALKPTGLPIGVVRGCPKCSDCQAVLARWRPQDGCKPSCDEAPVFYPTDEEFKDTLKYIAKIRPAAEPFGICRVVPPPGWRPPCPLREDVAKLHVLKFPTRVQEIHKLQVRKPVKKGSQARQRLGGRRGRGGFRGRMGRPCRRTPNLPTCGGPTKSLQADESFGFEPGSYFSLGMFEKYAQQFKEQYFFSTKAGDELPGQSETSSDSGSRVNPSVDAIEAEYWRIVERPTEQIEVQNDGSREQSWSLQGLSHEVVAPFYTCVKEVLYGADVETGSFGSGFPKAKAGDVFTDPNSYEKSGWNLNNIARLPGSMLAFEEGDISGVLVPWLYVGMCFSSFCWHVEDHHFYSLNYLHWGAPKVWYGVAGHAAHDMEAVMKKHLPELFDEQPDLLHKLVTQLSPSILKAEGLPVHRLVQQAGEFVITFPGAYHSGFNCGFNCAEAVNLAPVDWLPHGQGAVELYREQRRKTSVSHDKLLLAAAREAVKVLSQSQNQQGMIKLQGQAIKQEVHEEQEITGVYGGDAGISYAWQAFCGQGGVLVKALKARVELERLRQASLIGEVQMKKMDHCYDATDERECAECHYDLHLSAVGCDCCPDKYVCLAHAGLLCVCQWGRKFVTYRYDLVQLHLLVAALEEQPGALSNWVEREQYMSSMSSFSTISSFPQAGRQDSGLVGKLGPCEFNSTEFSYDGIGFKGQDAESSLASQTRSLTSRTRDLEGGISCSHQWNQGIYTQSAVPLQRSAGAFVNNIATVPPVLCTGAAGLDARKISGTGMQTRRQLGISSEVKRIQNGLVKIEKKVLQTSSVTRRKEVIVLSDDDEGTLRTNCVELSTRAKAHGGNNVGLQSLCSTMPFSETAGGDGVCKQSMTVADAGVADVVSSVERQSLITGLLNDVLPGAQRTLGCVGPESGLSIPISTSMQLPSTTLTPPLKPHVDLFVAPMDESPLVTPPPVRPRSIGSLKQQARAASTQHLGPGSRLVISRADHLQRLKSGPEVSGAELCGQVPTPDTLPPLFTQAGNVQSRTPTRVDRTAGPRVAKVLRKKVNCEIDLLNVGSLIHRDGWHNTVNSIFPAGFKSRISFCNVLNISQTCYYVSEIVDRGEGGPHFKVSMEGNCTTTFADDSIDACWQAVQERINGEIIRRRGIGETDLPPLHPPQSLHGLDMFGLTSTAIIQSIEALDPQHQCREYWTAKLRSSPLTGYCALPHNSEQRPSTSDEVHTLGPKESGANVEVTSRPTTPTTGALSRRGSVEYTSGGNVDIYGVLKGFFQTGKSDELWALHRLFSCEWQGKEWRDGFQALTDVLDTRLP